MLSIHEVGTELERVPHHYGTDQNRVQGDVGLRNLERLLHPYQILAAGYAGEMPNDPLQRLNGDVVVNPSIDGSLVARHQEHALGV